MKQLDTVLKDLQNGKIRSANKDANGQWTANLHVKQSILDIFKHGKNCNLSDNYIGFVDKDNLKTRIFTVQDNVRMVPGGSSVRPGSYVAPSVIIMPPSYVNIGCYIDSGTMIDSHVLIGSCAQVGRNVHVSAGVQIGGVLEPIGMNPVIIEDDVFLGAGSVIVEGIIIGSKAVIAPSVVLSRGVNVYDCVNERILKKGEKIPNNAVVVPGSRPIKTKWAKQQNLQASCPIIVIVP